jgi:hypothetical protein
MLWTEDGAVQSTLAQQSTLEAFNPQVLAAK